MEQDGLKHESRSYWKIWLVLLVITSVMVVVDQSAIGRGALVLILVVAMLAKATLIGSYFMHLRFERFGLVLTVAIGLLVTGALLFVLIAPDGLRALHLSSR